MGLVGFIEDPKAARFWPCAVLLVDPDDPPPLPAASEEDKAALFSEKSPARLFRRRVLRALAGARLGVGGAEGRQPEGRQPKPGEGSGQTGFELHREGEDPGFPRYSQARSRPGMWPGSPAPTLKGDGTDERVHPCPA